MGLPLFAEHFFRKSLIHLPILEQKLVVAQSPNSQRINCQYITVRIKVSEGGLPALGGFKSSPASTTYTQTQYIKPFL